MKRSLTLIVTLFAAVLLTGAVVHAMGAAAPSDSAPAPARSIARPATEGAAAAADCEYGEQDSGARYLICMPTEPAWNQNLMVYAHGYMAPDREIEIPMDQMVLNGVSITETVTGLGYAFATTSYSTNGLAVRPAISDLLDLVNIFTTTKSIPDRIYLLGVSEGGLITTLSVEEHPDVYDGGLAMCGPYGDFQGQINHFGDFRVVFDYFFPGLVPGDPLSITASLQQAWQTGFFTETVMPVITDTANAVSVTQLLSVTGVSPYEFAPPTSTASIERLLWYNVFATNDGVEKLGGQPYGNVDRFYTGSSNDAALNDEVVRVTADPTATAAIEEHYQTTGELSAPLVTLHTTGDPVVPYRHALEYRQKVEAAGSGFFHQHFEVDGHGHCAFSQWDVLTAFGTLVEMVNNPPTTVYLPAVTRAP